MKLPKEVLERIKAAEKAAVNCKNAYVKQLERAEKFKRALEKIAVFDCPVCSADIEARQALEEDK